MYYDYEPRTVFDQILFSSDNIFYALVFIVILLTALLYFTYNIMKSLEVVVSNISLNVTAKQNNNEFDSKNNEIEDRMAYVLKQVQTIDDSELTLMIHNEKNPQIKKALEKEFFSRGHSIKDLYYK